MKTVILSFFVSSLLSIVGNAQKNSYTVNDNNDANKIIPAPERFQYSNFTTGKVVFKDRRISVAPLNYNHVLGDIQFIHSSGDTLSIADEALIKYIIINSDTFYYDKAYLQLIDGGTEVKLAKSVKMKIGDIRKMGAYDMPSSSSGAITYTSVNVAGKAQELTTKQEVTLQKATTYYIGDETYHFLPANKKNLLKMFAKKQNEISAYLQANKVDFNSKDDLEKLVSFLRTLSL